MRFGIWLYGLATVVTGILDLVWGTFEASHQPLRALGHIPGEHVLAYIAGVWPVARQVDKRPTAVAGDVTRSHPDSVVA
jgi:hypothetical protein